MVHFLYGKIQPTAKFSRTLGQAALKLGPNYTLGVVQCTVAKIEAGLKGASAENHFGRQLKFYLCHLKTKKHMSLSILTSFLSLWYRPVVQSDDCHSISAAVRLSAHQSSVVKYLLILFQKYLKERGSYFEIRPLMSNWEPTNDSVLCIGK